MFLERLPQARLASRTKAASDTSLSMISQHRNVVAVSVPPQFVNELDVDDRERRE